jgi:antitoxin (DNA-binding transcriptional repressor) of toxin-antitoxin stability system
MSTLISIKDFRHSLAAIANAVEKGESFLVMRRSKPAFLVKPFEESDEEEFDMKGWKTIIDFTEGGKKQGIPAGELLNIMKKFEEKYG